MSIGIYFVAIIIWIMLVMWTWNSAGLLENNKIKTIYITIGIVSMAIVTFIVFCISKTGVKYPNEKMIAPVKNMLMLVFTPINGFFVMPYLVMQIGKLNIGEIKETNFRKKIITIIVIFIVILIIECFYFKNIQNGILSLYAR